MLTKDVNPWELIHDKAISQLVFAYEMVLTEMRTHGRANKTIREWVERLDSERDEFAVTMSTRGTPPDEPTAPQCEHDLAFDPNTLVIHCLKCPWTHQVQRVVNRPTEPTRNVAQGLPRCGLCGEPMWHPHSCTQKQLNRRAE